MKKIEATRIKGHCEANGYQMVYQPGIDTFRAFKTIKKPDGSETWFKVEAIICHRGDYTVILTMNNRRASSGKGINQHLELRRLIEDVEQLKEIELEEPILQSASDYFFEIES